MLDDQNELVEDIIATEVIAPLQADCYSNWNLSSSEKEYEQRMRLLEKHERGSVDDGRGGYCASDADPCQWDRPLSGGCGCWHRRWIGSIGK